MKIKRAKCVNPWPGINSENFCPVRDGVELATGRPADLLAVTCPACHVHLDQMAKRPPKPRGRRAVT